MLTSSSSINRSMLDFVTCLTAQSSPTPQLLRKMYGPSFNSSSPASLSTPTPTFISQPSRMADTMRPTSPRSSIGRTRRLILPETLRHSRKSISRVSLPTKSRSHIPGNDFHRPVQHVSASAEQASTYYQQEDQDRRHFG